MRLVCPTFQPVTHAGRHVQFDPLTRLTNSDIIACITAQLPEWFRPGDFFPVPCCFPSCRSITYLLTDGEHVVPIPRLLNVEDYLDYVSNRVIPDLAIREALENLWSASAVPGTDTMTAQLQRATAALNCAEGCGINLPEALTHLTDRVFAIVIQDFQDPYTLNVKQLMKCCVQQITPDGRLIPFCAYNSVGYREQVREQLTGVPVPDIVPNAIPLAGLLADAPHGSKQANTGGSIARLAGPTRGAPMALPPQQIKACCADAYSRDIVALLLGDSFHPGGATLTRRLADQLGLRSTGDPRRVADIAAGPGASARLLASDYGVAVDGVDISEINVKRAQAAVAQAPPIGGPRPAAMAPAAPHRLTPCARRSAGKASTTSPSEAGTRTAAPMPCSTRNATSSPTLSAIAHSPDATVNNATPKMNTRLRPIRSASLPAATRNAAKTML